MPECLGLAEWTSDGLTDEVAFVDLKITVDPFSNRLTCETHQKSMNLCLCTPPNSAHANGPLRGLVFGRMRACWHQNTDKANFVRMAKLLSDRLIARGCSKKVLLPLFVEATKRLDHPVDESKQGCAIAATLATEEELTKPIFFHLPCHPRGTQRTAIRKTFNASLKKPLSKRSLTVAVSGAKNLGDRVCRTRLPDVPGCNPSDFI